VAYEGFDEVIYIAFENIMRVEKFRKLLSFGLFLQPRYVPGYSLNE